MDVNVCQLPPKPNRLTWWTNQPRNRFFILLGYWYSEEKSEWRFELREVGKTKSVIHPEAYFNEIVEKGLLIEVLEEKLIN